TIDAGERRDPPRSAAARRREPGTGRTPWTWSAAADAATRGLLVVGGLAVGREIEALALDFRRHAETDDQVDDLVEDQAADAAPADRDEDAADLRPHLGAHGHAFGIADAAERPGDQDAGADRADDAADAVDAEHVEAVVVADRRLHHRHEDVAED